MPLARHDTPGELAAFRVVCQHSAVSLVTRGSKHNCIPRESFDLAFYIGAIQLKRLNRGVKVPGVVFFIKDTDEPFRCGLL